MANDGTNKLVRMANQIADNFNFGSRDKAVAGVLDHLMRFWTPDMKRAIVEHHREGDIGLNEIAVEAIRALSEKIGQAA